MYLNKKYWINIAVIIIVMISILFLIHTDEMTKQNNCLPIAVKVCENHNMTFVQVSVNWMKSPYVTCSNNGEPVGFRIICPD